MRRDHGVDLAGPFIDKDATMPSRAPQICEAELKDLETIVGFNIAMAFETESKRLPPQVAKRGVELAFQRPEHMRDTSWRNWTAASSASA